MHRVEDFAGSESVLSEAFVLQVDPQQRRPRRGFDLHVLGPWNGFDHGGDLVGDPIQLVEVVAKNIDRHQCGLAGQRLAQPIGQKGHHFGLEARIVIENRADRILCALLRTAGHVVQLDVELAAIRFPGVFTGLGTADLMFDAAYAGNRQKLPGYPFARTPHRFQGRTRRRDGLNHKMALPERRHQLAAKERQCHGSQHSQHHGTEDHRSRTRAPTRKDALVEPLHPLQP